VEGRGMARGATVSVPGLRVATAPFRGGRSEPLSMRACIAIVGSASLGAWAAIFYLVSMVF